MKKTKESEKPLVSVIIPTYNRRELLSRAIKSVLRQSYQEFELIIVDDGSSDGTQEVIQQFSDPRIKYMKLEENQGQPAALNRGIRASQGTYVAFLDDDDELLSSMLESGVKIINQASENTGFVVGRGLKVRQGKVTFFNEKEVDRKNLFKAQLQYCAVPLAGAIIKRSCFEKVGYLNEKLILGNDWEFMLRLLREFDYIYLDQTIYIAHYDDLSNITHICQNAAGIHHRLKTYGTILRIYHKELKENKRILAKYYFRIAQILYFYKKFRRAKRYLKNAIENNPMNIRYMFYYVLMLLQGKLSVLFLLEQRMLAKIGKNLFSKAEIY
ncbi:MAG: glycosyltransferase [Candidatus Helarchaeota archaeon]